MNNYMQLTLAILAFGVPAFFVTRLRLGLGEKGGTRYASSYAEIAELKSQAARGYVNRLLLKMGWAWVLICAPLLAYQAEGGLDLKIYGGIVAGCLFLGIILSAVTYNQIETFSSVDVEEEELDLPPAGELVKMMRDAGVSAKEMEDLIDGARRVSRVNAQKAALEKAQEPLRRSNRLTFGLVFAAAALIPLVYLLASWGSGLATVWYVVLVVASLFGILITYVIATQRWI
jgi:hypothetical protein